jgi:hypothetical protein
MTDRSRVVTVGWIIGPCLIAGAIAPPWPAGAAPAQVIPGDGTYRVGADIAPGTYVTAGGRDGFHCIWYRHSTLGASSRDTIDTGASTGQQVVTIAPTDATFETGNCQTWSLAGGASNSVAGTAAQSAQTPTNLPGLQRASEGQPCSNTKTFIFALAPDGHTLACLPSHPPSYGLSATVAGVRPLGASCSETSQLGQSVDGEPMMCMGSPAIWSVYRDY